MSKIKRNVSRNIYPDSIASNRWANVGQYIVGVVGNTLTLAQHWSNTKDSTVEVLFLVQRWLYNYAPTVDFELWGQ